MMIEKECGNMEAASSRLEPRKIPDCQSSLCRYGGSAQVREHAEDHHSEHVDGSGQQQDVVSGLLP